MGSVYPRQFATLDAMPEKPQPTPFALELQRRRRAKGLSQASAARLTSSISRSLWNQVELGYESLGKDTEGVEHYKAKAPSREFVIDAARILDWDRAEALTFAGYDPEPDPRDQPLKLPPTGFLDDWRRLSREQQEALDWTMRLMLNPHAAHKNDARTPPPPKSPRLAVPADSDTEQDRSRR